MIRSKNNKNLEAFCTQIASQMSLNSHSTLTKPKWKPSIMLMGVVRAKKDNQGFVLKEKSLDPHLKIGEVNVHVF